MCICINICIYICVYIYLTPSYLVQRLSGRDEELPGTEASFGVICAGHPGKLAQGFGTRSMEDAVLSLAS
jgi:hypothetical protein